MTGAGLKSAAVAPGQLAGQYAISFVLELDASDIFAEYTSTHSGQYLGIVLDKVVVSAPIINEPITGC